LDIITVVKFYDLTDCINLKTKDMPESKKISKLQFITMDLKNKSHELLAEKACEGGARWIQLRIKDKPYEYWLTTAEKVKNICDRYQAELIINDHVQIARQIGAAGVHLGQTDMHPNDARKILGSNAIIGGTANTFEELKAHVERGVDYIGLGPFRYTTTKLNLSPVIGIEGYKTLLKKCADENIQVPVIAIGGIEVADIHEILQTGVYGIAISSAISFAKDETLKTSEFITEINKNQ